MPLACPLSCSTVTAQTAGWITVATAEISCWHHGIGKLVLCDRVWRRVRGCLI